MPRIPYSARDFPPSLAKSLTASTSIDVSWHEVVWAAISVGKRGIDDMLAHDAHSIDEMSFRMFLIYANLWESGDRFRRSPAYDDLDPTEKGSISYFLGMAIAKLFASRLFGAHWMVHLDRLVNYHSVGLTGRSRPDLAGQDVAGRWLLFEGKGRTGVFSQRAMDQAKEQVQQVRAIDGSRPYLRVGVQTFFEPMMTTALVDPDTSREDSVALDIGIERLRAAYYRRFIRAREESQREIKIGGRSYRVFDQLSNGVSIGIASGAEELAADGRFRRFVDDEQQFSGFDKGLEDNKRTYHAFPDGLAVGLDERWSKESMAEKPFDRK